MQIFRFIWGVKTYRQVNAAENLDYSNVTNGSYLYGANIWDVWVLIVSVMVLVWVVKSLTTLLIPSLINQNEPLR
jgi:hypothetical protein